MLLTTINEPWLLDNHADHSVGRGVAGRVVPEVNVDWRRPGQRRRYVA